jgi:DNA-binding beta-propeller fold protein YncE
MRDEQGKFAQFNQPIAVVVSKSGIVYIADRENHRIRKIALDGTVTTLAGTGVGGYKDGLAKEAEFKQPYGVCLDKNETAVFVADYLNHAIRKIDLKSLEVTTLAGNGTAGFVNGEGAVARFNQPYSIKFDGFDSFYVPDQLNHTIRKVTLSGKVTTIAGSGNPGYSEGIGAAAQFNNPTGVAVGPDGTLYVADRNNNRIRKIETDTSVTTLAGTGVEGDKNGSLSEAEFRHPLDLVVDKDRLFVSEDKGHRIRAIE